MSADMFLKIEGVEGEAVDHKHGGEIDIALVDYNMPGMTGLELFCELEGMVTITKRALLTANIQDEIRNKTLNADIEFMNKPISDDVIAPFINS